MCAVVVMMKHMDKGDVIAAFLHAMASAGVVPPVTVIADGNIHRFATSGRKLDDAGWYVLHLDDPAHGAFGDFRAGLTVQWRESGSARPLSLRQRAEIAEKAERRRREQMQRHTQAADRARQLWVSAVPAAYDHPYLLRKRVHPYDARQLGERLVLPVCDLDGTMVSLQFIGPDGEKRFLTGGAKRGMIIPVHGDLTEAGQLLICEGWATGATLAEEKPMALVLAALDAGNLLAVTAKARRRWCGAEITVCADADPIGRKKGRAAAIAGSAFLATPDFPPGAEGTDFNDLAAFLAVGGAA